MVTAINALPAAQWDPMSLTEKADYLDSLSDIEVRGQATMRACESRTSVAEVLGAWVAHGYLSHARALAVIAARLLLALALLLGVVGQAEAAPAPVRCSEITAASAVEGGRYAGVTCPEGSYLLVQQAGQALPALGPATVLGKGARIKDAAGVARRVVR